MTYLSEGRQNIFIIHAGSTTPAILRESATEFLYANSNSKKLAHDKHFLICAQKLKDIGICFFDAINIKTDFAFFEKKGPHLLKIS